MSIVIAVVIVPVAVAVAVPAVIVLEASAVAFPISGVELLAVMPRRDPTGPWVRRTRPVAIVPSPAMAVGIPVAVDPDKLGTRTRGHHSHHARRRRRTDANPNRDLTEYRSAGQKRQGDEFLFHSGN